ncbi:alpha/beta fold hydrolase [Clostridium sp. MT-14]|jgi:pimeloyl-ACP methyl ester carboxylesterase|uniref:Alpha/beta hydrolase n=1 Tax=Clostridium aromativorans TaxID=2836848 RepID=A0ABS8NB69_9CLOT|nr:MULTISPECIES: hypothetical protein [Clostridium]MCC9296414.1 hypothetical protein [Clostridium aromativorans]CAB1244607.1 hypothetical protein CLOSBL3_10949 [Clostridiaceae bacterium BL-3]
MKEYIVDNMNSKIRYHDLPGEDTPILFIHGLGCAGSFDYPEIVFAHSLGGPVALELANKCRENIETIILSEANLDKSSRGSSSYEFGTYKEEDFVNGIFDEVVNENSSVNSMWVSTLSVCSSAEGGL